ncbi:MAG: hypothetical protein GX630_05565 [Actinobacteria bacterium]|nr:hypothetical protein [Actinomycetota bacterium]
MTDESITSELLTRLERCMETHDREQAVGAILDAVEAGSSMEDLYSRVLEPFLKMVGRRWQERRTTVWEEHLIVGAVRTAVEALYPRVLERKAEVEPVPLTVAFFCPPEETHDIGLRMLADRFDMRGFRTVYVGAMTPVVQMVDCVRTTGASVICLSASTHYQRSALHEVVARLHESLPQVRIVVGGPAFAHSDRGWEQYVVHSVESLLDKLVEEAQAGAVAAAAAQGSAAGAGKPLVPADEERSDA